MFRARLSVPVVAMEPAIKPAVSVSQSKIIGVLATSRTLASERFARLADHVGQGRSILQPCPGFVEQGGARQYGFAYDAGAGEDSALPLIEEEPTPSSWAVRIIRFSLRQSKGSPPRCDGVGRSDAVAAASRVASWSSRRLRRALAEASDFGPAASPDWLGRSSPNCGAKRCKSIRSRRVRSPLTLRDDSG